MNEDKFGALACTSLMAICLDNFLFNYRPPLPPPVVLLSPSTRNFGSPTSSLLDYSMPDRVVVTPAGRPKTILSGLFPFCRSCETGLTSHRQNLTRIDE